MHVGNQENSKNLWSEEQHFANNVLKEIKKAFTKFMKHVWPFYNTMHETVNSFIQYDFKISHYGIERPFMKVFFKVKTMITQRCKLLYLLFISFLLSSKNFWLSSLNFRFLSKILGFLLKFHF